MPRILFDCERMKYPNTGLFSFCDELGSSLMQQLSDNEKMYFYIPQKLQHHFGENAEYIWQSPLHKIYLHCNIPIDVWHATYQSSPYSIRRKGMRKVLTIHDLNFLHEGKSHSKAKKYLLAVQRNIDSADVLVAISNFARNDVLQNMNTGNKPFHVIYNGAAIKQFPEFNTPHYLPVKPFLFALGTVLPKKNFHVLPCLLQHQDAELVIAGNINENYRDRILDEAKKFNVASQVRVIGPITEQEKYWYYRNCLAFLFPSLAEGFGLPAIEAMHFGKPVFMSDKTSLPEVGGNAAYYFRDFDPVHMQETFQRGMEHFAMEQPGEKIIQHAAKFSWKKAAASYMDVYRSLY